MSNEEIKALSLTLGNLSESECDALLGLQSKLSFPYANDLPAIGQVIQGMTDEEVTVLVDYVNILPLGPGNGKRKIRKQ